MIAGSERDYVPRLQRVDWEDLFSTAKFGKYLEALRNAWTAEYDFTLIDSRTGITDIGGICTIHLPDVLVAFFTANYLSLDGVADVLQRARRGHSRLPVDRRRLLIIPVPSRDETDSSGSGPGAMVAFCPSSVKTSRLLFHCS